MRITKEQFDFIKNNWHKRTLPQLMAATYLTRYKIIQVCNDNGFIPHAARRTANYKARYEPTPKKVRKYFYDENGVPRLDSDIEKKPFIRIKGEYSNQKSLYKELQ